MWWRAVFLLMPDILVLMSGTTQCELSSTVGLGEVMIQLLSAFQWPIR
jgi:hypothetical protein